MVQNSNSFKQFIVRERFLANGQVQFLGKLTTGVITDVINQSLTGEEQHLLVVHAPYPKKTATGLVPEAGGGHSTGRTALLEMLGDLASTMNPKPRVYSYLENRERLSNSSDFLEDVLLSDLNWYQRLPLERPIKHWIISLGRRLLVVYGNLTLAISGFFAWFVGITGLELFSALYDPEVESGVNLLLDWVTDYWYVTWGITIIGLISLLLGFLYKLNTDDKAANLWNASALPKLIADYEKSRVDILHKDPEGLFKILGNKNPIVLVVDDVEFLDSPSFETLLNLFNYADSHQYPFLLILGYNPQSVILNSPEKVRIRKELSFENIQAQCWMSLEVPGIDSDMLRGYAQRWDPIGGAARVLDLLRPSHSEHFRSGEVVEFIDRLTSEYSDLRAIPLELITKKYNLFQARDSLEVDRVIAGLQDTPVATRYLKYLLAFETDDMRIEWLRVLLRAKGEGYSQEEIQLAERMLLESKLIERHTKLGIDIFHFVHPYIRHRMRESWTEWKEEQQDLQTHIFDILSAPRIAGKRTNTISPADDLLARQALLSRASRRAIVVLSRKGDYYYQYFGQADAGHALAYYGSSNGGALQKWRDLCADALEEGSLDSELIEWNSSVTFNPYQKLGGSSQPWGPFYAPQLLLIGAELYWMTGYSAEAEDLLNWWLQIAGRVQNSKPALAQKMIETTTRVRELLARIHFTADTPATWDRAAKICKEILASQSEESSDEAHLILALIDLYRADNLYGTFPQKPVYPDLQRITDIASSASDRIALHAHFARLWVTAKHLDLFGNPTHIATLPIVYLPRIIKTFETLNQERVYRNRIQDFTEAMNDAWQRLIQIRNRKALRPQDKEVGVRTVEAEIIYWEGVLNYLRACALYFELLSITIDRKNVLSRKLARQVIYVYEEMLHPMLRFVQSIDLQSPNWKAIKQGIIVLYDEIIEVKEQKDALRNWLPARFEKRFEEAYSDLIGAIQFESNVYMYNASTILSHLGYSRLQAPLQFHQTLATTLLNPEMKTIDVAEGYFKAADNSIGVDMHLEGVFASLWGASATSHLPMSAALYGKAAKILDSRILGLMPILYGEAKLEQANEYMLAQQNSEAIEAFKDALAVYEACEADPTIFDSEHIESQKLRCLWSLCETSRRQSQEVSSNAKEQYLNEALYYIDLHAKMSGDKLEHTWHYYQAIALKALIYHQLRRFDDAVLTIRLALNYFTETKSLFWQLQASLLLYGSLQRVQHTSEEIIELLRSIEKMAELLYQKYKTGRIHEHAEKSLLNRTALTLAEVLHHYTNAPKNQALQWVLLAFEIHIDTGLFAAAILLDPMISDLLPIDPANELRRGYIKKIAWASLNLNPRYEKVDYTQIAQILKKYFFSEETLSEVTKQKGDLLTEARNLVKLNRHTEAITLLDKATSLIIRHQPDNTDIEILRTLVEVRPEGGEKLASLLNEISDIVQSRDFLQLAKTYLTRGWNGLWALEIATNVRYQVGNPYYEEAVRMKLSSVSHTVTPQDQVVA